MSAAATVHSQRGAGFPGSHSTGSLAELVGAELIGPAHLTIDHLDTIDRGGPGSMSFIRNAVFAGEWAASKATAALVSRGIEVPGHDASSRALLVVDDADLALIKLLELFAPETPAPPAGVHSSAVVDPTTKLGEDVAIGPNCTVGAECVIESGAVLMPGVVLGRQVRIGRGTVLHPNVCVLDRCRIGAGCILHAGVVIGADGFGYRPAPDGRGVLKVPHIGIVEIGDLVEVGANTCIDRAKFGATVIGSGTKIDNLVQIAHNCRIGRACIICGETGLAGSVTLGDGVVLGGSVSVMDNTTIGSGARVAANGGVMNDIPAGETWIGLPAMPVAEGTRNYAVFRNLAELSRTVRKLQKRLEEQGPPVHG